MAACRDYFRKTGRRISFEYALIKGVNDTPEHAGQLARLLDGMICHVNLIPVNPVEERGYDRTAAPDIRRFVDTLTRLGVNATVRRELAATSTPPADSFGVRMRKRREGCSDLFWSDRPGPCPGDQSDCFAGNS